MQVIHLLHHSHDAPFSGGFHAAALRVLITGVSVFLAVAIVPGIEAESLGAGLAAVLVLTVLNLLVRPVLFVLTLPLIVLSLGLFLVVLNALLLELTAYLVKGFTVAGFWPAVGGALVISLAGTVLNFLLAERSQQAPLEPFERRPPKIINPTE
jgi:putative membrane protein